jgi:signal transduction histidine kinase
VGQKIHALLQTVFPVPFEEIEDHLRLHRTWHGRVTQATRKGEKIVVDCLKSTNEGGDAVLEVNRDITAELRAEEALRETEKLAAMGRVAGIIAHEINNPLAAITNIFYLLRNHPSLGDDARRLADLAEEELERVSHITRQTLSFYRESKQPISVFVPEVLDDVLELQHKTLIANRITVRKHYQSAAMVKGFPVELRQVFLNLIGNAIQAMPDGGVLGIYVRESTDWTTNLRGTIASIVDTGKGIRPEDRSRLFQPFFSTKSTKGTGLGLWISQGIVQKHEGRITCRTFRAGEGSVTSFRVFLPGTATFDQRTMTGDEAGNAEYKRAAGGHGSSVVQVGKV